MCGTTNLFYFYMAAKLSLNENICSSWALWLYFSHMVETCMVAPYRLRARFCIRCLSWQQLSCTRFSKAMVFFIMLHRISLLTRNKYDEDYHFLLTLKNVPDLSSYRKNLSYCLFGYERNYARFFLLQKNVTYCLFGYEGKYVKCFFLQKKNLTKTYHNYLYTYSWGFPKRWSLKVYLRNILLITSMTIIVGILKSKECYINDIFRITSWPEMEVGGLQGLYCNPYLIMWG